MFKYSARRMYSLNKNVTEKLKIFSLTSKLIMIDEQKSVKFFYRVPNIYYF